MSTNESEFAKKLTSYLDDSAASLKAGTAYKLQLARVEALARLAEPQRVEAIRMTPALVGAGGAPGSAGGRSPTRSSLKLGLAVLLIVATVFGYQQWQLYQQLKDLEETDAAILSSDLPIDAYLDRGFQNWLKSDSE
jgi:hypothetical protein